MDSRYAGNRKATADCICAQGTGAALPKIANVEKTPAPDVEILTFNERGPVLAVRPYCNTAYYWQVYFDTNRTIRETFGAAGYPAAEAHLHVRHKAS